MTGRKVGFPANILAYTDLTKPFNDCSEREPLCRIVLVLANDTAARLVPVKSSARNTIETFFASDETIFRLRL